ncbi:Hypothetical predicted protein [Paramuricea clavata]|uniref:Uncharacterized protein n=1 Tax=Paramuricea clavata TaxID=317549 RepID=A0A7D9HBU5_PARCT|nr:Hypothetical predicted protein [Paramuricea clavata]
MNSSTVINALYSFFGKKKNKLTWSGSLEDLKAFVLTIVDEETAEKVDPKKAKNSDLNKSLECVMAEASTEVDNISPDETPGPCTSLLQLGESCNHEATKQGLSEVEITSLVPEAVAANPCTRCDKHRRDIDKLNTEISDLRRKL